MYIQEPWFCIYYDHGHECDNCGDCDDQHDEEWGVDD
jgi:hypothetical protein